LGKKPTKAERESVHHEAGGQQLFELIRLFDQKNPIGTQPLQGVKELQLGRRWSKQAADWQALQMNCRLLINAIQSRVVEMDAKATVASKPRR